MIFAVREGAVPRDRKYKNSEVFWWDNLCDKASSLEMGAEDINLVLKFIKEAEASGILAVGCAELFKKAHDLKKELKMEINFLSNTIVDLYCRQLALNEQVEGILCSQKIQQRYSCPYTSCWWSCWTCLEWWYGLSG